MYGWGRGFGTLDYYGLLAQANLEDCSPMDSACVSNNVAKQAAVEDLWVNQYMKTGAPDDVKLSFTPQSEAEVSEFYNPSDPFNGGNVVDTRGILSVASGGKTAAYVPPVAGIPPLATIPKPQSGNHTVINSSGPAVADSGSVWAPFTDSAPGGSMFSSVPWWGWLGAAGLGLFALKGGR